jgi:hypothetical protein
MAGYELLDEHGKAYYAYHSDRDLCDDDECPCTLPSTPQKRAQERAEAKGDWYVSAPGAQGVQGPMSERQARTLVDDILSYGRKPLLLRVVEDYGR